MFNIAKYQRFKQHRGFASIGSCMSLAWPIQIGPINPRPLRYPRKLRYGRPVAQFQVHELEVT
jgi:hypothetical protein